MRNVLRRAARAVAVAGLLVLGTAVPAPGAWAATPFSAAGDVELIPGLKDAQGEGIVLSYGVPKVEVDLPRDLFGYVSGVRPADAADNGLPCEVFPDRAAYVCGNGSAKQAVASLMFLYVVPQVRPGTGNLYPKTYDIGVIDLGSGATATVHATLRPEVDLALHGPYADSDGGHGAAITVYVENTGPSDAQGATVTLSFTGAYTTFGFPAAAACTASGAVATCPVAELPAGRQVPVSVALGTGTGVISVLGRVSGPDEDLDHSNNAGVGGPWNLFPGNGSATAVPPPVVPARGIPLPAPVPDAAPSAVAPVPVDAPSRTSAPVRAAVGTGTPAWARDLAVAFLVGSSAYLVLAGALWFRRWLRRF